MSIQDIFRIDRLNNAEFRVIWIMALMIRENKTMGSQNLRDGLKTALKDWLHEKHGGITRDYETDAKALGLDDENW